MIKIRQGVFSWNLLSLERTIEHIFGYLMEIKGLQQWYGKFDQIEFDPNVLECKSMRFSHILHDKQFLFFFLLPVCLTNAGSLLLKINEYTEYEWNGMSSTYWCIICSSFIHEMSDVYTFFLRWLGFGRFQFFLEEREQFAIDSFSGSSITRFET